MRDLGKRWLFVGLVFVMAACGKQGAQDESARSEFLKITEAERAKCSSSPYFVPEDYRYVFSSEKDGAGCTTQCHIFSSVSELCAGLQNHDLNKGCAEPQRYKMHQKYQCGPFRKSNSGAF